MAAEPEEVTHVAATYLARSGAVVEFGFDKEVDRTQLFIPELIEDHNLDDDEFEPIKNALKEAFKVTGANLWCQAVAAVVARCPNEHLRVQSTGSLSPTPPCLRRDSPQAKRAAVALRLEEQRKALDEQGGAARAAIDGLTLVK